MDTRVVTAHIPIELAEQVDELAARLDRPKGWIVKQALISWVALEAKRQQLTLKVWPMLMTVASSIMHQLMGGQKVLISQTNPWHLNKQRVLNVILSGSIFFLRRLILVRQLK